MTPTASSATAQDFVSTSLFTSTQPDLRSRESAAVAVIGTNYVGLVTAVCLASLGHRVVGIDIDACKVARLSRGEMPIHEPGLDTLLAEQLAAGRLRFTLNYADALENAQFAFICVGTPPSPEGGADLSQVRAATTSLIRHTPAGANLVVVNKSTLPVGTGDWMQAELDLGLAHANAHVTVVSNPEFLREGTAVADFLHPDRVVIGGSDTSAVERVARLYAGLNAQPPVVKTNLRTAEMIKYASNAFLATKISFINEMAAICEQLDADVEQVASGMGLDQRIGPRFLSAGVGYGGSCFPKDVRALEHLATQVGVEPRVLRAVMDTNLHMRQLVLDKVRTQLGWVRGRTVGILGLAFKANTDDVRESPAIEIARTLVEEGAYVRAFDPVAMGSTARLLDGVELCPDAYAVAENADALLVLTEWPEFRALDMARVQRSMRQPLVVDGRNLFAPEDMADLGFTYLPTGRGVSQPSPVELQPVTSLQFRAPALSAA
jgi:UDPglucose 6-dehydrogenase